jgi:hypothetical protein
VPAGAKRRASELDKTQVEDLAEDDSQSFHNIDKVAKRRRAGPSTSDSAAHISQALQSQTSPAGESAHDALQEIDRMNRRMQSAGTDKEMPLKKSKLRLPLLEGRAWSISQTD